jgi:SMI1-KNR4 cell-wall
MNDLAAFSNKWSHPDYPPIQVGAEALGVAEVALGSRLPASYRAAVLDVGLPRPTGALLGSIVDNELDLPDIGDFFAPDEMVSSTTAWRSMGLPPTMTAFASDCMGNLFAFEQEGGDAGPVYFFDHDSGQTELLADSFAEWIGAYCQIPWKALED